MSSYGTRKDEDNIKTIEHKYPRPTRLADMQFEHRGASVNFSKPSSKVLPASPEDTKPFFEKMGFIVLRFATGKTLMEAQIKFDTLEAIPKRTCAKRGLFGHSETRLWETTNAPP